MVTVVALGATYLMWSLHQNQVRENERLEVELKLSEAQLIEAAAERTRLERVTKQVVTKVKRVTDRQVEVVTKVLEIPVEVEVERCLSPVLLEAVRLADEVPQ